MSLEQDKWLSEYNRIYLDLSNSLDKKQLAKVGKALVKSIKNLHCHHYEYARNGSDKIVKVKCSDKDKHCLCCCPYGTCINIIDRLFS